MAFVDHEDNNNDHDNDDDGIDDDGNDDNVGEDDDNDDNDQEPISRSVHLICRSNCVCFRERLRLIFSRKAELRDLPSSALESLVTVVY